MSRVIKFRAWDKTRTVNCSYDTFTLLELLQGRCKNPENYENWEEFTALTDKKGKGIYEGDFIAVSGSLETVGQVMFEDDEGQYVVATKTGNAIAPFHDLILSEWEIIGNIYENPNLLDS